MKRSALQTWVGLCLAAFTLFALTGCSGGVLRGGVLEPARQAPLLALTDHTGQ